MILFTQKSGDYDWTEWFNIDSPDGDGDLELLGIFNLGCQDDAKLSQVQTVDGKISLKNYIQTGLN
jgi:hypothetical protein